MFGGGDISGRREAFSDLAEGSAFSDGDLPPSKSSELMNLGNLESSSTTSLFCTVNRILDESIEKNNYETIPLRVGSVLKLILQEIERRVSKQADDMKKQSVACKSRDDSFSSRIRALENLASGNTVDNEVVQNQLQHVKNEKMKLEEKQNFDKQDLLRLREEKETYESQISCLSEELISVKKSYEEKLLLLDKAEETKDNIQKKIVELECLLSESVKKTKELTQLRQNIESWFGSLQELRSASECLKQDVLKTMDSHAEDLYTLGVRVGGLMDIAQTYHGVLEENIKLHNEVHDLKGNIRVYCRVRPGESGKQTTVQYVGENGEVVVMNPLKPRKDSHRLFKFKKVFGPAATQEEVYRDLQPLIRSVLDGYNVCIFAYGQTGSGKTYTMTGPNAASSTHWGVNYRALNDLFMVSQKRSFSFAYEICVQMVEIYNEQVRDLLCSSNSQKRLGIWSTSQPNGVAVPDASLHPARSTSDVIELMGVGLANRAVGATALNERSSRSHSILTVLVHGTDSETKGMLRGCLHLVDLAGSERIDRTQATGDRLKEAQLINKSLSALGDVIFALAQKSPHVPYRNSKLTQVLQTSLGGKAKTVMCVQINPDAESYSETVTTLKFAERVASVELGPAKSHREDRGVRELMEQIASLKDTVARKEEEISRFRLLKTSSSIDRCHLRNGSSYPRRHSLGGIRPSPKQKAKAASDCGSEYSDRQSEFGSQQSVDDYQHHREFFRQSRLAVLGSESYKESSSAYQSDDVILFGLGDEDSEERLSDISDGVLSIGTETDGSIGSIVEYTLFPETTRGCD